MTASMFLVAIRKGFGTEDIQYPNCILCLVSWFINDGAKSIKICLQRQYSVLTGFYLHSNHSVMLLANSKHFFSTLHISRRLCKPVLQLIHRVTCINMVFTIQIGTEMYVIYQDTLSPSICYTVLLECSINLEYSENTNPNVFPQCIHHLSLRTILVV